MPDGRATEISALLPLEVAGETLNITAALRVAADALGRVAAGGGEAEVVAIEAVKEIERLLARPPLDHLREALGDDA